ncbi:decaprenyl-phosphate phosphoribosyltransferase [Nocardioides mangrovi]|uniref:Decaprenyl-phosphate phosphoribosyltransferase n=1 Tax=Nocardioides mangrovi TaxID=2874580 RepID=A0ABS7U887_9ACTN|nr:decaprenyl-phosphate phosphoribosyltransferase [Nocardioides mangrovi]MBZ5736872.1 decaprenyl-phosphate phosphoribosyltransferase [Nocardioides mangrovi]
MTAAGALLRALRPKQWTKNLLVVAAPLAAGDLAEPGVLGPTVLAFVAFCLASSSIYLVNDSADVEADRLHPRKRFRPIAAGELSIRTALLCAAVLFAASVLLAVAANLAFVALLVTYVAVMVAYSLRLKHEPVLDLALVAAGFLMRAVAGGLAADIPISDSFLMVAGFGSLFIVAGKRYSELHTLGSEAGTRRSLVRYTDSYLRFVWSIAAAVTITAYSLWAFENAATSGIPWHTLSIVPFVVGLLRYAVDIDAGQAAEPEDIVWGDRLLQGIGVVWVVVLTLGVVGV